MSQSVVESIHRDAASRAAVGDPVDLQMDAESTAGSGVRAAS